MTTRASLLAGLKAVAMGTLVGMSLPTAFAAVVAAGLAADDPLAALFLVLFPFLAGLLAAALGLAVFGWPLTAWLHRMGRESWRAYVLPGAGGGALLVVAASYALVGEALAGVIPGVFGGLTGGATAHFWWVYARRKRAMVHAPSLEAIFE
ncbi:MAG: hypothetical protein V2I39_10330 [Erythrobacter sp.]|jgi:hypothetical protein|nr:hypothetical protein [Erythrobacter sp.]